MRSNQGGPPVLRAVRAAVLAVLTVLLAGTAHVAVAGGPFVTVPLMLVALAVMPVCWLAGRGRFGTAPLAAILGGAQVAVHLLHMGGPAGTRAPVTAGGLPHGHLESVATTTTGALPVTAHLSPAMLAAHVLATVVAVAVVLRADDLVHSLRDLMGAVMAPLLTSPLVRTTPRGDLRGTPLPHPPVLVAALLRRRPPRRGPPLTVRPHPVTAS